MISPMRSKARNAAGGRDCNWTTGGYSPRGRPRPSEHKESTHVCDSRFCPGESFFWRGQHDGAVAAFRPDLRDHVFSHFAAATKAHQGPPGAGKTLAPRRYREYVGRTGRQGDEG